MKIWKLCFIALLFLITCVMIKNAGCATNFSWSGKQKILGQYLIIASYGGDPGFKSFTVVGGSGDWKFWKDRGVTLVQNHTWFDLLDDTTVDTAVSILTHLNFGDNPNPVVAIDEFSFDIGGQTDEKCAEILKATKKKDPKLSIVVYDMGRAPINKVLGNAYKSSADLIEQECYISGENEYWKLAAFVRAARMHGLMDKCVILLGIGDWIKTKQELEEQIRFTRLMAPESPGVAFFGMWSMDKAPDFCSYADELCGKFFQIPTDGKGLPDDAMNVYRTFTKEYKQPALVCSPGWAEPDRSRANPHNLVEPITFRVYFMNIGKEDAKNVKVRLRNTPETGNDVFAEGTIDIIPAGKDGIAVLSLTKPETPTPPWKVWKTWQLEVDAPGCEILNFK